MKLVQSIVLSLLLSVYLTAQSFNEKPIYTGSVFFDYFYFLQSRNTVQKDSSGFQLRRVQLSSKFFLNESFNSKILLELEQNNGFLNGAKFDFYLKDAYLSWNNILNGTNVTFGLAPTPGWQISEPAWAYRSIEKTIMDLNRIENSRDLGIDVVTDFGTNGVMKYWFKVGNNSGTSSENNKNRKYYSFFHYVPNNSFQTALYFNYAPGNQKFDLVERKNKSNDTYIYSYLINYKYENYFSVGAEMFSKIITNYFANSQSDKHVNQNTWGISLWGWAILNDKMNLVFRFDRFDPNDKLMKDESDLFILAFDYHPIPEIKFIPNIELFNYYSMKDDLIARLSLAFYF